jgi:hypothetical protein
MPSLLVLVIVVFASFSMPAHAASGWSIVPSPNPAGAEQSALDAVSCTTPTHCFAVGLFNTSAGAFTLVERWDGSTWSIVPSPNPAGTIFAQLNGVSCTSVDSCVAVGRFQSNSGGGTLVQHWNGSMWSLVPSPNPSGATDAVLSDVSCITATDCVAVGGSFSSATLIERWDGSAWSIVPSPSPGGAVLAQLTGVSCIAANSCFAVGQFFTDSGGGALIERWNGSAWSLVPTPAADGVLEAVSCVSASRCYAVGGNFTSTLIERWDGTAWSIVSSPNPDAPTGAMIQLSGLSCVRFTQCVAVGRADTETGGATLIERLHGHGWSIEPSPNPPGESSSELLGVSCTRVTACFAVGHSRSTLIERP